MKRWRVGTVSGGVNELEKMLQNIEDTDRATIVGVLSNVGPYQSWTVVWYTVYQEATPRGAQDVAS